MEHETAGSRAQFVGQTSGLPVAKPPVLFVGANRHPEDALTGRPEVGLTLVVVPGCTLFQAL